MRPTAVHGAFGLFLLRIAKAFFPRINRWHAKALPERKKGMIKRIICVLMVLILGIGTLGIAAAQELRENIRFTGTKADRLWAEAAAGRTIADLAENARKEGLEHPLAEDDLAAAGARIDREDGVIYMIRSARELGKARTAEEAARMAWSLAGLLGGDEEMELELYARLNIGKTGIYCFSQTQDGMAMYGRMLKIVADEDGSVHTVISSLGFPEETDESLGMEEDLLSRKLEEAETPDVPDFKRLIPAEWKSEAETGTGEKISVTVPVARDPETGLWYLADPVRKIMLGDFKKLVLDGQKDCLLTSPLLRGLGGLNFCGFSARFKLFAYLCKNYSAYEYSRYYL